MCSYLIKHMFKALIATAAVAATSISAPAIAGSWDYCKSLHGGMRICALYRSDNDVVAIADPSMGYVRFGVRCTLLPNNQFGWEWEVFEKNGSYNRQYISDFSKSYCEGRLNVEAASQEAPEKYYLA